MADEEKKVYTEDDVKPIDAALLSHTLRSEVRALRRVAFAARVVIDGFDTVSAEGFDDTPQMEREAMSLALGGALNQLHLTLAILASKEEQFADGKRKANAHVEEYDENGQEVRDLGRQPPARVVEQDGEARLMCVPTSEMKDPPGGRMMRCKNCNQTVWVSPIMAPLAIAGELTPYCRPCTEAELQADPEATVELHPRTTAFLEEVDMLDVGEETARRVNEQRRVRPQDWDAEDG